MSAFLLALDIDKAYDMVHRGTLDKVMAHIGIADNAFYQLMVRARDFGCTAVKGALELSPPFKTSRGIK